MSLENLEQDIDAAFERVSLEITDELISNGYLDFKGRVIGVRSHKFGHDIDIRPEEFE